MWDVCHRSMFVIPSLLVGALLSGCALLQRQAPGAVETLARAEHQAERTLKQDLPFLPTPVAADQPAATGPAAFAASQSDRWQLLQNGLTKYPRAAAVRYKLVHQSAPKAMADLAPYAFLWPSSSGRLDGVAQLSTPAAVREQFEGRAVAGFMAARPTAALAAQLEPDTLVLTLPVLTPTGDLLRTQEVRQRLQTGSEMQADPRRNPFKPQSAPPAPDPASSPAKHRGQMELYRRTAADPAEARIAEAGNQLMDALLWGRLLDAQRIYRDWPTFCQERCITMLNAVPAPDPASAELAVYTDGSTGYRVILRYPSGAVEDTAMIFGTIGEEQVTAMEPGAAYFGDRDLPLLAAFNLVAATDATLPLAP